MKVLNQSIQDMNTREECMTIDLEKVAALMNQAASDGEWCKESLDGWTNTLMDILEKEYQLETQLSERIN